METEEEAPADGGEPATVVQVREALDGLSDDAHRRLAKAARVILSRHPRLAATLEPGDLVNQAALKALDGERTWYRGRVDFYGFMFGAMRSLASNATRAATTTEIQTVSEAMNDTEDGRTLMESVASEALTPEELVLKGEREAQEETMLVLLRANLAGDTEALAILDLLLKDVPKREIRTALSMTEKEFWTVDRRLSRAIQTSIQLEIKNK